MKKAKFDKYAAQYDHILSDIIPERLNENGYFAEYKVALVSSRLNGSQPARILDFGCGAGRGLPYLKQYFPETELWGYDISPESLKVALRRVPDAILFSDWSAIIDIHFDVIIAANVFHHIPPVQRQSVLEKCHQALTSKGHLFLFEHNPYNLVTRWIFEHCPFDDDAIMLNLKTALSLAESVGFRFNQYGYTLFFPRPFAFLRGIENSLRWLPLGAQYYIQMVK